MLTQSCSLQREAPRRATTHDELLMKRFGVVILKNKNNVTVTTCLRGKNQVSFASRERVIRLDGTLLVRCVSTSGNQGGEVFSQRRRGTERGGRPRALWHPHSTYGGSETSRRVTMKVNTTVPSTAHAASSVHIQNHTTRLHLGWCRLCANPKSLVGQTRRATRSVYSTYRTRCIFLSGFWELCLDLFSRKSLLCCPKLRRVNLLTQPVCVTSTEEERGDGWAHFIMKQDIYLDKNHTDLSVSRGTLSQFNTL